jgi:uncharacterized membrane protein YbhN (UPF0104 family)
VLDTLRRADPEVLVAVLAVATVRLTSWGLALRTVLGVLGSKVSARLTVLVFVAATFANNVTAFGQAGGEPVTALFVPRTADTGYETGLAAIASVDSLNFVPSILLALVGIGYFSATVAFGRRLMFAAVAVGVLTLVIPVLGYLGWPNRYGVKRRIEGFFHAIECVTGDRRGLAFALGFSLFGWLSLAGSLWLSLYAIGFEVPVAAVPVVIPVAAIASITPLPGGLGGVETVLVALIVPTTGVTVAAAPAAVVVHRTATYWLPTLVGDGAAAAFGADGVI